MPERPRVPAPRSSAGARFRPDRRAVWPVATTVAPRRPAASWKRGHSARRAPPLRSTRAASAPTAGASARRTSNRPDRARAASATAERSSSSDSAPRELVIDVDRLPPSAAPTAGRQVAQDQSAARPSPGRPKRHGHASIGGSARGAHRRARRTGPWHRWSVATRAMRESTTSNAGAVSARLKVGAGAGT